MDIIYIVCFMIRNDKLCVLYYYINYNIFFGGIKGDICIV